MSRPGRVARALVAFGVALGVLAAAACGDVPLIDPAELAVPLAGAYFDVRSVETGAGARVVVRGHAYGYADVAGQIRARYLDAGEVEVGGWPARREYVRPAEPEYVAGVALEPVPRRIEIDVGGSAAVPSCTLRLRLPYVGGPADGAVVPRDADLVVPLGFAPDSLGNDHRVSVRVRLVGAAGSGDHLLVSLEREQVRSPLVIPAALIAPLPPGAADLLLRVEWLQPTTAYAASPCAPTLLVRASFEARRHLRLD